MDPEELAEAAAYLAETEYGHYESTGDREHLNDAVRMAAVAVATIPEGHHSRAGFLNNLSVFLQSQYRSSGQIDVVEEAVRVAQQAVHLAPDGDPARADWLATLADALEI